MATQTWVRKMRGGVYGPWHAWRSQQTWCGRRMPGVVDYASSDADGVPSRDPRRVCGECERAMAENKPKPYRRR